MRLGHRSDLGSSAEQSHVQDGGRHNQTCFGRKQASLDGEHRPHQVGHSSPPHPASLYSRMHRTCIRIINASDMYLHTCITHDLLTCSTCVFADPAFGRGGVGEQSPTAPSKPGPLLTVLCSKAPGAPRRIRGTAMATAPLSMLILLFVRKIVFIVCFRRYLQVQRDQGAR